MKNQVVLMLATVAVVVSGPAAWGQKVRTDQVCPSLPASEVIRPEPVPAPIPSRSHNSVRAANEQLVSELILILQETKSPDTFLVTVNALACVGPRAKAAVPAIIRHAERLGLLKDILSQVEDDDSVGTGVVISEAIAQIIRPMREGPGGGSQGPVAFPFPVPPPLPPMVPSRGVGKPLLVRH
jgi:hypothetical protein